jgi:hypothetical protein
MNVLIILRQSKTIFPNNIIVFLCMSVICLYFYPSLKTFIVLGSHSIETTQFFLIFNIKILPPTSTHTHIDSMRRFYSDKNNVFDKSVELN